MGNIIVTCANFACFFVCFGLTLLSCTSWMYAKSHWLEESYQRLDLFLIFQCQIVICLLVSFAININQNDQKTERSRFSYVILATFLLGSCAGIHHLIAICLWWFQSTSDLFYKHLLGLLLYSAFACLNAVCMAIVPLHVLTSRDTSFWKIRIREKAIYRLLQIWYKEHTFKRSSERSHEAFQSFFKAARAFQRKDVPYFLVEIVKTLYFQDILSRRVDEDFLERQMICAFCKTEFEIGELYIGQCKQLRSEFGKAHLDCFLKSPESEVEIQRLNLDTTAEAFKKLMMQPNLQKDIRALKLTRKFH